MSTLLASDRSSRLSALFPPGEGSPRDVLVPAAAALLGIVVIGLGPLYALPVLALVAWYAVVRVAAAPAAVVPWAVAFSLLGDKMVLSTGVGGGVGLLRLGPLLTIALAGAMLLVDSGARRAVADVVRWGSPAALFVAIGAVLPVVGSLIDYPFRTVTAAIVPLSTGAFFFFGVLVARTGADLDRIRYLVLVLVTSIAAVAGLLLFLNNRGITLPFAVALDQWEIATAEAYGTTWLRGRVGGLYTSPNVLGTLGGLALVCAAFGRVLTRQRIALVVPALAILFVTQSRGVMVGTFLAIAVGWLSRERSRRRVRWQSVLTWALIAVLAAGAVVGAAAVFPQYIAALSERINSAARILTEGVQADRNFAGRVAFWGSAWELLQQRVLGTFGPPEMMLGSAVDNDYLRFALQGGFLYAGAWVFYLAWLMRTGLRDGADRFVGAGAVFLAFIALTQIPSTYVMIVGIFSLFVGMHIEQIRVRAIGAGTTHTPEKAGDS
ncbi:MAG: O-antigen ligase family protein [Coriobacteriia bacterium]|nr:O-antigen ligase family protein [Coriobacteriia bacterium]